MCVALGLLSLGLRIWFSLTAPTLLAVQTLTPCRLDALCAGSWFALSAQGERALSSRWTIGCLIASGAAILGVSVTHVLMPEAHAFTLPTRTFLLSVFFGVFIYAVTRHPSLSTIRLALRAKWLRSLGKYSYGLYVFHGIVAYAMAQASPEAFLTRMVGLHLVAAALQIAFALTVSMLLAVASYELFERRFLMLKKRFDYAGAAAPAATGRERAVTGLVPTT
jgi:peptidoglycan/LPS O-acetylase OafA/YrhL